ncbi:hypothetical protein H1R20_g1183, partial [Candolleomyces eurysporus]
MSKEVEGWENVGDGILMRKSKLDHNVQMNDATEDRDKSIKAKPNPEEQWAQYRDQLFNVPQ